MQPAFVVRTVQIELCDHKLIGYFEAQQLSLL
jgi:hypothetical protein